MENDWYMKCAEWEMHTGEESEMNGVYRLKSFNYSTCKILFSETIYVEKCRMKDCHFEEQTTTNTHTQHQSIDVLWLKIGKSERASSFAYAITLHAHKRI